MKSRIRSDSQTEPAWALLLPQRQIVGLFLLVAWGMISALSSIAAPQGDRGFRLKLFLAKTSATDHPKAATERPELVLQSGHAQKVDGIAFSPDGRLLVSGSADSTVKIWDVTLGRELRTLTGHTGGVRTVAFSPDGRRIASGGLDGKIKLWEVSSGREVLSLAAHPQSVNALAFSRDGRLASGGTDQAVKVWEVATGREVETLTGHTAWITTIAFSPDGQMLASGSADNTVRLWEVATGRELKALIGHSKGVRAVAFSPDGQVLASGSSDATVRLWRLPKGRKLQTLDRHSGTVLAIAFSPDGTRLITGSDDRTLKQFDTVTGREVSASGDRDSLDLYEAIALSPDGNWEAVSSGNRTIELRRVSSSERRTLRSHSNSVLATAVSPDGRWFASGHKDTTVKLWDLWAGREVRTFSDHAGSINALAFSPDGQWLAAGSLGGAIKLWDVTTGSEAPVPVSHSDSVNALAFSQDGQWLVSAGGDRLVKLWEVGTQRTPRTFEGHANDIHAVSLSPDNRLVASGSADRTIKLREVSTGREVRKLTDHTGAVNATAFSPDGRWLASASSDKTVKLWEVASGRAERTLTGHLSEVYAVAFSPDGRWLASGSADKTAKLWEVATGRERFSLGGHSGSITSLAFAPNGRWLASGSEDGSTRLWEIETGDLLATLVSLRQSSDWLVVTPDGLFDGSPAAWSQILWRFAQETTSAAPVEVFFNEFYYPDLLAGVLSDRRPRAAEDISQRDRRQPSVKLTLASGQGGGTRAVTVKLEVSEAPPDKDHPTGSGARDVRLFRNGSLVRLWRGDQLKGREGPVPLEATIPVVAGENRLTAYAFNRDNIKSLDATLSLTGANTLKRQGVAYLLAVGINLYANADYNLKYAVDDAQVVGEQLQRQQVSLGRFAQVEVISLLDREATKANITAALKRLGGSSEPLPEGAPAALEKIQPAQPEDVVIVYFAGHGTAQAARFYLIPHDLGYAGHRLELDDDGLRRIVEQSISDEELERYLEAVDAGQLLLVIDACNSGKALDAEDQRRGPMNSKGLAQLAYEKGMNILTAAQSYQAAHEDARLGHGYLTYALVEEGVKRMAADLHPKDGKVMLREWLDYATERVPQIQEAKLKQARILNPKKLVQEMQEAQRPRVFYRREVEDQPLVIAQAEPNK